MVASGIWADLVVAKAGEFVGKGEQKSVQRRPRVLIAGKGEPRIDEVCAALMRRGVEPILASDALEAAIRTERPNLVLLVGDASSDDGARGIDVARRAGPTPAVVATDPEPFDRRLAPFQYGACGIVVRRNEPEEMAGEIHHLLAENARRVEERVRAGQKASELDSLVGLVSRDLRMSATPHEGLSRITARSLLRAHEERSNRTSAISVPDAQQSPESPPPSIAHEVEETSVDSESSAADPPSDSVASGMPLSSWPEHASEGDRVAASMLLAIPPPVRPPIEDRASPLRAQVMRRQRASIAPALYVLTLTLFTAFCVLTRMFECGR
jgi:hypothetical protein